MPSIADRLRHTLIPAVPVPMTAGGTIHDRAHASYVTYMRNQPIGGVSVWAHTGRGLHLTREQRANVLTSWRAALPDKLIIAGAGGSPTASTDEEYLLSAAQMGEDAVRGGADALLVYAPTRVRGMAPADASRFIIEYHHILSSLGVPVILFYLYEDAGGISYTPRMIKTLAANESVIGMKIATADSVMTYQEIASLFASAYPEKLVITGEDRFFGYSLMCGAHAALVGMGSALPGLQSAMMNAYYHEAHGVPIPAHAATDPYAHHSFLHLSALVDDFGRATFAQPLQGYIQRMLWCLVELGIIPEESSHDPWGPELPEGQRMEVTEVVKQLSAK